MSEQQYYCTYLKKFVDPGLCYDMQMISGDLIKPSALPDVEVDKAELVKCCDGCAYKLAQTSQEATEPVSPEPQYMEAPVTEGEVQPPQPEEEKEKELPMKWFKYLIYFSLIVGSIGNFLLAILLLTGRYYSADSQTLYETYNGLKAFDMVYAVTLIALAVCSLVVRQRLAGYYRNGPVLLNVFYVASSLLDVVHTIGLTAITANSEMLDVASLIGGIVGAVAMVFINNAYFRRRSHLFVK